MTKTEEMHRKRNFQIHAAIDTTKLGEILDDMVRTGDLPFHLARHYREMGNSFNALLRAENDRIYEKAQPRPTPQHEPEVSEAINRKRPPFEKGLEAPKLTKIDLKV